MSAPRAWVSGSSARVRVPPLHWSPPRYGRISYRRSSPVGDGRIQPGNTSTRVCQATLLIVGDDDPVVLQLNREAMDRPPGKARLEIVPGASHLFEEPGALERVAHLARDWFVLHLRPVAQRVGEGAG